MFEGLYPDLYASDVYSVPYGELMGMNITSLLFDIDNTLAPHYVPFPDGRLIELLAGLSEMGFGICVLSNGSKKRVLEFMSRLPYGCVYRAGKPLLFGINKALGILNAPPSGAAIVGDQIFTDILVGKRKKVYTVLVKPISEKDEFIVKLKRGAEGLVINEYEKRRRNRD